MTLDGAVGWGETAPPPHLPVDGEKLKGEAPVKTPFAHRVDLETVESLKSHRRRKIWDQGSAHSAPTRFDVTASAGQFSFNLLYIVVGLREQIGSIRRVPRTADHLQRRTSYPEEPGDGRLQRGVRLGEV